MLARFLTGVLFILLLASCMSNSSNPAFDTLIINATIWSPGYSGDADAVAIFGDSIVAIGKTADLQAQASAKTTILDAKGNFLTPGFIDAHVHFLQGGFNLASVQLRDAASPTEFIERIAAFAKTVPAGTWITGGDWNHENWGGELPTRDWIDSVTAEHPVMINRLDGHMVLVNSKAMAEAKVGNDMNDIPGGEIVRFPDGRPTGIFKDNAADPFYAAMPEASEEQEDRALQAAMQYVASHGVTSVHHMGTFAELDVFERNWKNGKLITRIYAATPLSQWEKLAERMQSEGQGDEWLHWGVLKGFVDGSLGSHTAAFFEPFTDAPQDSGLFVTESRQLEDYILKADKAGLHIAVHAIGDKANTILLDIFEKATEQNGERDRRFRIEHAQHLRQADLPRFAELGVIPSMQPYHAIDDGQWAEKIIGGRIRTTYAFRSLLDANARLTFGSDWFVAPPIPLEGIYAAVSRRTLDGANPDGWVPEEKITVEEALRAYTINGAYASFEEDRKGSIALGKLADLVLLDTNLLQANADSIRQAKVLWTMVGGKVVYER